MRRTPPIFVSFSMKFIILLSILLVFICFSANSAEIPKKIEKNDKFRVEYFFWVTSSLKHMDSLKSAVLEKNIPKLEEMAKKKQVQMIKEKDRLRITEVGGVLGTPYVKAEITRRGRKEGSVYILEPFLHQFCKQDTK